MSTTDISVADIQCQEFFVPGIHSDIFVRGAPVWFPKSTADHFDHFNVVGLEALIDRANSGHLCGIE
jgi:hypothetical protein